MRHVKCVYSAVGVQCPVLWLRQRTFAQIRGKSTLEIVQVDAGLSALCLGLEGLDLAGFGACAPCLHVSAGCHEPLKGPLLRGFSSQKRAYEMQLSHAARALRAAPLRSRAMRARARAGLGSETRNKGKS